MPFFPSRLPSVPPHPGADPFLQRPGVILSPPALFLGQVFSIMFGGIVVIAGFSTLASKYASFALMALWIPVIAFQADLLSALVCVASLALLVGTWCVFFSYSLLSLPRTLNFPQTGLSTTLAACDTTSSSSAVRQSPTFPAFFADFQFFFSHEQLLHVRITSSGYHRHTDFFFIPCRSLWDTMVRFVVFLLCDRLRADFPFFFPFRSLLSFAPLAGRLLPSVCSLLPPLPSCKR
jgi:hypothetical protein